MQKNRISGMAMIRIDLGFTQQQLADSLGISRALVSMGERGERRLPQAAVDYLEGLLQVARQNQPATRISGRKRPSVASLRPAYNRIPFSARKEKTAGSHIATLNSFQSIVSKEDLRIAGEKLKEDMLKAGKQQPVAADACRQILLALRQKNAVTSQQLELLNFQKAAAPARAKEIKEGLVVITARLSAFRQAYKEHPALRSRFRKKIARLYLKKLNSREQLEKFNRPAIQRLKQQIAELKEQLDNAQKLAGQVEQRLIVLERGNG